MIRILIADPRPVMRTSLAALIDLEPDVDVVAQLGSTDDVVAAASSSGADVCLLDLGTHRGDLSGLAAATALRDELPHVRALMMTTFVRDDHLHRSLSAGAAGLVLKDLRSAELAAAVRGANAGLVVAHPLAAARCLADGRRR